MIHIQTRRAGLLVIASTVDDNREVEATIGLTVHGAEQRLIRRLNKAVQA